MKTLSTFFVSLLLLFAFVQCGGGSSTKEDTAKMTDSTQATEGEEAETKSEACVQEQNITLTVKDYKYGMSGDFAFDGKFEVKKAWYVLSESTYTSDGKTDKVEKMTIYLANYDEAEKTLPSKEGEMLIECILYARATKLVAETYKHSGASETPFYSSTKITTPKGEVYFNWIAGMPEQGNVLVKGMDGKGVCGEFVLKVDKPDSDMIGTVVLNGAFYAEKK